MENSARENSPKENMTPEAKQNFAGKIFNKAIKSIDKLGEVTENAFYEMGNIPINSVNGIDKLIDGKKQPEHRILNVIDKVGTAMMSAIDNLPGPKKMEKAVRVVDKTEIKEKKPIQQYDVLTPHEFLEDFKEEANKAIVNSQADGAKHRIWMQAMSVRFFGKSTRELFDIFNAATKNKFETRINVDSYDKALINELKMVKKHKDEILGNGEEAFVNGRKRFLTKAGTTIEEINPIKSLYRKINFIKGRNHIKITLLDDKAWVGGMNLTEAEFNKYEDFVVKITDPKITTAIAEQFPQVNANRPKKDYEVRCTPTTNILVDCGKPGESIILDRAVETINKAKKRVLLVSQFMPEGKLLKTMHDAHKRGVEFVCLQSDPKAEELESKILNTLNRIKAKLHPIPFTFLPNTKIHAKLLIVDDSAIFGSHNFSGTGVKWGTEEMAMQTTEPVLVKNLTEYFKKLQSRT